MSTPICFAQWAWLGALLLLSPFTLRAQPGGGGGLNIQAVYARDAGGRLVRLAPRAVRVRAFLLGVPAVTPLLADKLAPSLPTQYLIATSEVDSARLEQDREHTFLQLPISAPQRLFLYYRTDTMVLDVVNLLPPNGAGYRTDLDSLVLMPGYYSWSAGRPFQQASAAEDSPLLDWVRLDLTPSSLADLQAAHLLQYQPVSAALVRALLPDSARARTLTQASAYLRAQQPQQALATLTRVGTAGSSRSTEAVCLLRAAAYQQLRQPEQTEQWLTQAIALAPPRPAGNDFGAWSPPRYAYEQRLALRLRNRHYDLALADYDTLAAMQLADLRAAHPSNLADLTQHLQFERLVFQLDSLHDPQGARRLVTVLRGTWGHALDEQWYCGIGSVDNEQLRRLAATEYQCGDYAPAFRHWYQLLLGGRDDTGEYLRLFDRLVAQHPDQAELLLCRGLARWANGELRMTHTSQEREAIFHDLAMAEHLRPHDFHVNYCRAQLLLDFGEPVLAVTQLTLAISKEPTLPELYRFRHEVRETLGQVSLHDPKDPDYAKYLARCANGY